MKIPSYPLPKTKTPLLFSNQKLIALLIPLVIEQILLVSVGVFDTLMVASIGEAAVSAVSLVDAINALMVQVFVALGTGGAVVASQYIGHRSYQQAKISASQLVFIIGVFALSLTVVICTFHTQILSMVFGALDAEVMGYAQTYLFITALSYPFIGLYNGVAALFRAQGNSKVSMFVSLSMNVINILGNTILIFGFGLGVLGAALATLLSRVFAAVIVFVMLQMGNNPLRINHLADLMPQKEYIKRILSIGIPSGVENGMFQFGRLAVSGLVSTLSTAAIAANAIGGTMVSIINIPSNAIGLAVITVVGQCIGAGEKEQAKYYSNRFMIYAYLAVWVSNILSLFTVPVLLPLFGLSQETISIAQQVLLLFSCCAFVIFVPSFVMPSALRSAGDAKFTMWVSILSMWIFRIASSYLLVVVFNLGILGVWAGMCIDWLFRAIFYSIRYLSGRWLDKKVI